MLLTRVIYGPAVVAAAMEPILQAVLGMRPARDADLLTMQSRSIEALAGFLAARPASMPAVLQKVTARLCLPPRCEITNFGLWLSWRSPPGHPAML